MNVVDTALPGVLLIEPTVHRDDRGSFLESFHAERYEAAGITGPFVQDNVSVSRRGVLRGLHFQQPHAQQKLVGVLAGEVFDVAVDVRAGSPTFGRWTSYRLSADNKRQLYVPEGFAHGFLALSDHTVLCYKCSDYYRPDAERVLRWDDPEVAIEWPMHDVILSARDAEAPSLQELVGDLVQAGAGLMSEAEVSGRCR
jgi:dTDP-4-dehydrorhamnose 3,5-epimerase